MNSNLLATKIEQTPCFYPGKHKMWRGTEHCAADGIGGEGEKGNDGPYKLRISFWFTQVPCGEGSPPWVDDNNGSGSAPAGLQCSVGARAKDTSQRRGCVCRLVCVRRRCVYELCGCSNCWSEIPALYCTSTAPYGVCTGGSPVVACPLSVPYYS